ncbi:MAG: hypothetical protein HN348_22395, partial [Proteobacteria bacterium]|nr:hypothetical protein [Pseudomonadota bacterium]
MVLPLATTASVLGLFAGCHRLPEGTVVDEQWGIPVSEIGASLMIPCADVLGSSDSYNISIDDQSGWTVIHEEETDRLWLRDPFGLVPDRCWWVPAGPSEVILPDGPCISNGLQDGQCTGDDLDDERYRFSIPGVATAPGTITDFVVVDGILLAWADRSMQRLDLSPSDHDPVDDDEDNRTFHEWLGTIAHPEIPGNSVQLAAGSSSALLWDADEGRLYAQDRKTARRNFANAISKKAPKGEGVLAAGGAYAAIVTEQRAKIYRNLTSRIRSQTRDHSVLNDGVLHALINPETSELWVLTVEGVVGLPETGSKTWHSTPGARRLFLGRPAGEMTAYAWGNVDGLGVVYRLEDDGESTAFRLDSPLLGAGTGEVFQEIVTVTEESGKHVVRGWLDSRHIKEMAPNLVGLAVTAFVESPTETEVLNADSAQEELAGLQMSCEKDPLLTDDQNAICCAQQKRGEILEQQLTWLGDRMDPSWPGGPVAMILAVNPTALIQSNLCDTIGAAHKTEALPLAIGNALDDWSEQISLAMQIHSSPFN